MEPNNLLGGLDLDNPMSGLDARSDVEFKEGHCIVAEIRRDSSSKCSKYVSESISPVEVDNWIEASGKFADGLEGSRRVRLIFPCTTSTALDENGNSPQLSEALELALNRERFTRLTHRYQFTSALEAWRYRSLSGYSVRKVEYDSSGAAKSITFTLSIRLSGSFASAFAINHNYTTCTTVVLALRVCPYEQTLLQQTLERHANLIGHPLLVPTTLGEVCLETHKQFTQKILHELSIIEKTTGQHGWLQIPAVDASAHDSELSRLGHAVKHYISVSRRRVDSIQCHLDWIMQCINDPKLHDFQTQAQFEEWIGNIELMLKFRQADVTYSERRADNQITAVRHPIIHECAQE
ncbi:hypothetical protein ASPCAL07566 [Aspergillus calidoustus]|uniref:Uncharacterized protein n=1 Tax=Aspergillus calidoustus TaxID=454130 RepID=A0A0U5CP71_ASPCI|nr:hypothetical protein ASPCAL07566 [Aspergillus calidoustus]